METGATTSTQRLAAAYGDAWNAHDLEAIMSMHASDSVFHLNLAGAPEIEGIDAIRAAFASVFATWPDIHFATTRLYTTDDLFVHEYTITATLAEPLPIGPLVAQPSSAPISFTGIDVIPVRDGKVIRKDTYLDLIAALQQLRTAR